MSLIVFTYTGDLTGSSPTLTSWTAATFGVELQEYEHDAPASASGRKPHTRLRFVLVLWSSNNDENSPPLRPAYSGRKVPMIGRSGQS